MKTERQQTRDRREDRCEREEKFARPMDTLPGKTLRDRTPASRRQSLQSKGNRLGSEVPFVTNVPLAPQPIAPAPRTVRFEANAPEATSVQLAGTFNAWKPSISLSKGGGGLWSVQLELEPGDYQYRFIVDGIWQEDPSAVASVENPFGTRNSIVQVN